MMSERRFRDHAEGTGNNCLGKKTRKRYWRTLDSYGNTSLKSEERVNFCRACRDPLISFPELLEIDRPQAHAKAMLDCILFLSPLDFGYCGMRTREGVREISPTEMFLQRSNNNRAPVSGTIRSVLFLILVEMIEYTDYTHWCSPIQPRTL